MAIPAYRSIAEVASAVAANCTISVPAGTVAGDILTTVILVYADAGATAITAPAGWESITGVPYVNMPAGTASARLYFFWKVATGSEPGSYTFTHASMERGGYMFAVSDAKAAEPLFSPAPHSGQGTTSTATGITTTVDNTLIAFATAKWSPTYGSSSPPTGSTPTFTERRDPSNGYTYLATGLMTTAGATGDKSHANGNGGGSYPWAAVLLGYEPAEPPPEVEQEGFQFFNDDGSESSATTAAAQDTAVIAPIGQNTILRVLLDSGQDDPVAAQYQLEYKKSTDLDFQAVPTSIPSAPSFISAGTAAQGTAGVTVSWPTHQTGDIGLLVIESTGGQAANLSSANGFEAVENSPVSIGTTTAGTRLTVYWCRATSSAMASPTITDPGDHVYARILLFRGCVQTGNPWNVTATATTGTGTAASSPGVTTTVDNCLVVSIIARDNDSSAAAFSNWANASLTGVAELSGVDAGTTSGNGGGFAAAAGVKAIAGVVSATTATVTSSQNASMTIALRPPLATIMVSPSSNIAASAATATTARMTPPSGKTTANFSAGRISDDTNPLPSIDVADGNYTEVAWSLQAQSSVADDDIYQFRVTDNGTPIATYSITPTWTIGVLATVGALAVTLDDATLVGSAGAASPLSGSLTSTMEELSAASTGAVASVSEQIFTFTVVGHWFGSLTATLDDSALVASGIVVTQIASGSFASTLDAATLNSAGVAALNGALASTLEDVTLNSAGASTPLHGVLGTVYAWDDEQGWDDNGVWLDASYRLDDSLLVSVVGVSIGGAASATLDDLTLASSSQATALTGVLSSSLANVSVVSAGTARASGSLAYTLDAASLSASGNAPAMSAALSAALEDASAVSTGQVFVLAELAATLDEATLVASARPPQQGVEGNIALEDLAHVATGTVKAFATLSSTLDDATLTAAGSPSALAGAGALTLEPLALAASLGFVGASFALDAELDEAQLVADGLATPLNGALTQPLDAVALIATAEPPAQEASLDAALEDVGLVSSSSAMSLGTLQASLAEMLLVSTGGVPAMQGAATIVLADSQLASAIAALPMNGEGLLELEDLSLVAFVGLVPLSGDLAIGFDELVAFSTSEADVTGQTVSTLADLAVESSVVTTIVGEFDATLDDTLLFASTGNRPIVAETDAALEDLTVAADATVEALGVAAVALEPVALVGSGGGTPLAAEADLTLEELQLSVTSGTTAAGALAATLDDVGFVAAGGVPPQTGSASMTLDDVAPQSEATVSIVGSVQVALADLLLFASTGSAPAELNAEAQLEELSATAEGDVTTRLVGAATLDGLSVESEAKVAVEAFIQYTLDELDAAAAAVTAIVGAFDVALDDTDLASTIGVTGYGAVSKHCAVISIAVRSANVATAQRDARTSVAVRSANVDIQECDYA